ncbi:hypothetical protein PHYSODRAFT_310722 [Phytophthora sojae]|uniref:WRKY19-like zinc finger domain-containing protein n=1 Tax=Phytophthora sojae (strain P6497) TaxID=1094619 RepID=G4YZ27_PHYSP|nr:hypothetical protein PHYSODRAFT_310722 [Phytophthora sojae]EGZ23308.1 hypothetical protein PHYSODRAFT_310722 [Phytophthora sojae]|eukprot:XP_009518596.1 hypothetical protein PHYSODRAFT_310722 [Phytophthora sojae]
MVPTAKRNNTPELQFPSFLTQLKAPPSNEDPMRSDEQQWSSPTSITTNPTDATTTTSQPLPSFTLDQHTNHYYVNAPGDNLPPPRNPSSFSTPTGYYSQQLLPPRDPQTTSAPAQWSTSTYSAGAPMGLNGYLHQQPPQQPALHPLVLQHSEPMPRSNDEDLALDAQMLRELVQEMPGQTPVNAQQHHNQQQHSTQPRAQMPGLQLLFASPMNSMNSTDMSASVAQTQPTPGFYSAAMGLTNAPADMLLTMSQTPAPLSAAPVAPIFPPMNTQDRTLPGTLPLTSGAVGLTGAYDPLAAAGAMVPPPVLPRKKRTTATRICKVEGCTKGIRSRGLCKAHGGGRRCTTPGCTTSDQGGGHCVLHGGGRRCRIEGCKKSAQWRGVCKMHGGARRCRYGQCTKNGQVKQGYCRMHHNLLTAQRQQQEQLQAQQQQQLQHQHLQAPQLPPVAAVPVKLEGI